MENLYTHISHGEASAINLLTQNPLPEISADSNETNANKPTE